MLQYELLRKFQDENELEVPTLDCALRRAADLGDPSDIEALINLGANVNAQDSKGLTPLHQAVIKEKFDNVSFLIKMGARRYLKDNSNKSSADYAQDSINKEIKAFFSNSLPLIFQISDVLILIMKFLPISTLSLSQVTVFWQFCFNEIIKNHLINNCPILDENDINQFSCLPMYLRLGILNYLPHTTSSQVKELMTTLQLSSSALADRRYCPSEIEKYKLSYIKEPLLDANQITLRLLGVFTTNFTFNKTVCTQYGTIIFLERLINEKQILAITNNPPQWSKLQILLSKSGYIALKEKLLTLERIVDIDYKTLELLLSKNGLRALQKNIFLLSKLQLLTIQTYS